MKIEVITSFSKKYYEHIGKYSISTWLKYWPKDIKMRCYVEECRLEETKRIMQIPLSSLDSEFHGFMNDNRWKPRIKTFAKKGYSWVDAVENSAADWLIWLDADLMTKQPITYEILEKYCHPKTLASFMGVWYEDKKVEGVGIVPLEKPLFGSETCIYFFNLKHPEAKNFARRYKEYYTKGITENLRRFIDTDVWGACVIEFEEKGVRFNNFNPGNYKTPLPRTELHPYLQHLKAGLKDVDDLESLLREMIGDMVDKPVLSVYDGEEVQ